MFHLKLELNSIKIITLKIANLIFFKSGKKMVLWDKLSDNYFSYEDCKIAKYFLLNLKSPSKVPSIWGSLVQIGQDICSHHAQRCLIKKKLW